ncbi:hypothetical protein niasHT_003428 [Heterodera trifolii]|uniref:BACK domain-containing protein n=1 Tax=Heterodera trifolii TaxID=157864 RepID=A0ABD2M1W4_9BILA
MNCLFTFLTIVSFVIFKAFAPPLRHLSSSANWDKCTAEKGLILIANECQRILFCSQSNWAYGNAKVGRRAGKRKTNGIRNFVECAEVMEDKEWGGIIVAKQENGSYSFESSVGFVGDFGTHHTTKVAKSTKIDFVKTIPRPKTSSIVTTTEQTFAFKQFSRHKDHFGTNCTEIIFPVEVTKFTLNISASPYVISCYDYREIHSGTTIPSFEQRFSMLNSAIGNILNEIEPEKVNDKWAKVIHFVPASDDENMLIFFQIENPKFSKSISKKTDLLPYENDPEWNTVETKPTHQLDLPESNNFYEKGMPWKILAEIKTKNESTDNEKWLGFSLSCDASEKDGNWSHECSVILRIVSQKNGTEDLIGRFNGHIFNEKNENSGFRFISFAFLVFRCLHYIDQNISALIKSESFLQIDQNLLCEILKRDQLRSSEIEIWNAALRWADEQCHQNGIECSAENRREILGPALFNIRFPLIPKEEFTKSVVSTGVLTTEERFGVFQHYFVQKLSDAPGLFPSKFPTHRRYKKGETIEMEIEKVSEFALEETQKQIMSQNRDENSQPPVLDGPYPRAQDDIELVEDEAPVLLEVLDRLSRGGIREVRPVGPFAFALVDCSATFNALAVLFDCETPVTFDECNKRHVFEHKDKARLIYISEDGSAVQVDGVVKQGEHVLSIDTLYLDKRNGIDHFFTFLRTFGICFFMCQ